MIRFFWTCFQIFSVWHLLIVFLILFCPHIPNGKSTHYWRSSYAEPKNIYYIKFYFSIKPCIFIFQFLYDVNNNILRFFCSIIMAYRAINYILWKWLVLFFQISKLFSAFVRHGGMYRLYCFGTSWNLSLPSIYSCDGA